MDYSTNRNCQLNNNVMDITMSLEDTKKKYKIELMGFTNQEAKNRINKFINGFNKDQTNLVYINKSRLQLFRHVQFQPTDHHVWSNAEGAIFTEYQIVSSVGQNH